MKIRPLSRKPPHNYSIQRLSNFLADRFVTGTCPKCGNEDAYGDQCESCGSALNATELINPKSTLSGATPVLKETKHWFLPLDRYESFLKEWILEGHKKDWKPQCLRTMQIMDRRGTQTQSSDKGFRLGYSSSCNRRRGKSTLCLV